MSTPRYEIQEQLGQGGSGVVYRAWDRELQRTVAIKRLSPSGSPTPDEDGLPPTEQLRREALALSALQHPNIVTLYDLAEDATGPFVVMEYLEGRTLDDVVTEAPLPLREYTLLVRDTLTGLAEAHARNLLHRDLKPGNLMVLWQATGELQFKLLDFGLAKITQSPSEQTTDVSGSILGSIHYMAPEQFERGPLDVRTDLYALGCVFYTALTSHPPFRGETAAQVMAAHLHHDLIPLEALRPDLPRAVAAWTSQFLSRLPEDRPASAAEALGVFRALLEQESRPQPTALQRKIILGPRAQPQPQLQPGSGQLPHPHPQATRLAPGPLPQGPRTGTPLPRHEESQDQGMNWGLPALLVGSALVVLAGGVYYLYQSGSSFLRKAGDEALTVASSFQAEAVKAPAPVPVPAGESQGPSGLQPASARPVPAAPISPQPPKTPGPLPRPDGASLPVFSPFAVPQIREQVDAEVELYGTAIHVGESKSGKTRFLNFSRRRGETVSLAFRVDSHPEAFSMERLSLLIGTPVKARGRVTLLNEENIVVFVDAPEDMVPGEPE